MDLHKLKAIRAGNRSAVTRKLNKHEKSEEFPRAVLLSIFEELKKKLKTLEDLDEEILNQLTEDEEIIDEIINTDEYNSESNIRLTLFKEFIDRNFTNATGEKDVMPNDESPVFDLQEVNQISSDHATVFSYDVPPVQEKLPVSRPSVPCTAAEIHTHLPYQKPLELAHSYDGSTFDGSLLIGVNHDCWEIIGNQHIQSPRPSAVSSEVGYLLSGSEHSKANHTLVASELKTNKGITIPSFSTVASSMTLSSVAKPTATIPTTEAPPVRQPILSPSLLTVTLDTQRLETSIPGTIPVAHSTTTVSMFRTQPSTSQTAISILTCKGRPPLSSMIYPYFLPPDYLMQNYNIFFTSFTSDIGAGFLPNRTLSLRASLQVMYTFSGATGADVRLISLNQW
jgi:hypothetical protein